MKLPALIRMLSVSLFITSLLQAEEVELQYFLENNEVGFFKPDGSGMSPDFNVLAEYRQKVPFASQYLGDLYGLQVIRNVSVDDVIADFAGITTIENSGYTHSIKFLDTKLHFVLGKKLMFRGQVFDENRGFIWFNASSVEQLKNALIAFQEYLIQHGLASKYLIPNKDYPNYLKINEMLAQGLETFKPIPITRDSLNSFETSTDGLIFVPDNSHESPHDYEMVRAMLETLEFDFFAFEAMDSRYQPELDDFFRYEEGEPRYDAAKTQLEKVIWQNRFQNSSEYSGRNPHFELLEILKANGKWAYAMDYTDPDFLRWGWGENSVLGLGVRNLNWAASIPSNGKGIVFGGSSHFTKKNSLDVQDIIARRDANREIYYFSE